MNNKIITLFLALFTTHVFANTPIQGSKKQTCSSNTRATIISKLNSIDKFAHVDDEYANGLTDYIYESHRPFFKAKLLHSTRLKDKSGNFIMKGGKYYLVKFVIEPAPYLLSSDNDEHLDLYPSIKNWCLFENDKLTCTKAGAISTAIDNFSLTIKIISNNSSQCSTKTGLEIQYSVEVNDKEYQKIINLINEKSNGTAEYFGDLDDKEAFFDEFMNGFLYAFEKQDFDNL